MPEWENWSGGVACHPDHVHRPETEADIVALVEEHAPESTIRVAGSGHSFSPVVPTDDVLVSLERYTGIESVDADAGRATVRAGTVLESVNEAFADHGLAMENLGDIDQQTLAGALATGTHGTGAAFGILPTQIAELRLVTADGAVVTCAPDERPDLFRAAQVSVGAVGIVSALTLDLEPAYRLRMEKRERDLDAVLDEVEAYAAENRHFEVFWYPGHEVAEVKTINEPDETPPPRGGELVEVETGSSHEVFPSVREIRFDEMEYALPRDAGPAAMRDVREIIETSDENITFPVEYRCVAPDDIPLSPAHGRETTYVAVHRYHERPHEEFFRTCEQRFREDDGRPHWGKIHYRDGDDLAELYPEWDRFVAARERVDPDGVFLNDHLAELFG